MVNKRDTKPVLNWGYSLARKTDKLAKTFKCTDRNTWGKYQNWSTACVRKVFQGILSIAEDCLGISDKWEGAQGKTMLRNSTAEHSRRE